MSETSLTNLDFQQERIDAGALSPTDFEKLVFYLLDEMGFTDLVWRKGGEGNSSTDGGRDLEAKFWRIEPTGSLSEHYRVEVKHRKKTLAKSQVQKAVLDASGKSSVDGLIIVTSGVISNPCLDWINEFRRDHKLPKISIWQKHDLELLLLKNPRTLARFLPSALTFSGRCKVIRSRMENLFLFPGGDELVELWGKREQLRNDSFLLIASILSEATYGDLSIRKWGMWLTDDELFNLTALALINYFRLFLKAHSNERDNATLINGTAYLVLCVGIRLGVDIATLILYSPEALFDDMKTIPTDINDLRVRPIIGTIYDDLASNCSADLCPKLSYGDIRLLEQSNYFQKFTEIQEETKEDQILILNNSRNKCSLDIIPADQYCPLPEDFPDEPLSEEFVKEKLEFAIRIINARTAKAKQNA